VLADNEITAEGARVVALVADLLFTARVRGVAPEARTAQSLPALLSAVGPATRLVLVDVQARDAVEAVKRVKERAPTARVVAFGPHVAEGALAAVREAGADRVMPRGQFVRELAGLVAEVSG
jgi:DNA-binding NarL/FixJ family response regulator